MLLVVLLIIAVYQHISYATPVINAVPGIFSKKTESNGLYLPATSTYQPISTLNTTIQLTRSYTAFIHYQVTLQSSNTAFFTKLLINYANVGSVVHTGNNNFKTAAGFYVAHLNPGYYTFQVHYKSAVEINMPAELDWQAAVLQVIWMEDAKAVSNGIQCLPTPPSTNTYNNLNPLEDLQTVISIPSDRVVLSAYQLSVDMTSPYYVVTALNSDGFFEPSTSFLQSEKYLSLIGTHAKYMYSGIHYYNLLYRSPRAFSFADCVEDYKNNKNMYTMMMPSSCKAITIHPKTSFTLGNTDKWAATDLTYSVNLTKNSHVIAMYQFAGFGGEYIVMRLKVDTDAKKHTVSLVGKTTFAGNFGLWQGSLMAGNHSFVVEYRTPTRSTNTVSAELTYRRFVKWMNRAMTIIYC